MKSAQRLITGALFAVVLAGCAVPAEQAIYGQSGGSGQAGAMVPLAGFVKLPLGSDPSGLVVQVYSTQAGPGDRPTLATVDASGHFSVAVLAGVEYSVMVQDNGRRLSGLTRHVLGGTTTVNVDLVPNGSASGVVKLASGAGASGVLVYVPGTDLVGVTDANGAYKFNSLPVGTLALAAMGQGFANLSIGNVVVTAGATTVVATATITTVSQGGIFRSGSTDPTADVGNDKDTYLNASNGETFLKSAGSWIGIGSLLAPSAASLNKGVVTTLVGTAPSYPSKLSYSPTAIATDSSGNLFVAESIPGGMPPGVNAGVLQKVTFNAGVPTVSTIVGPGTFKRPFAVSVDANGNVYVADDRAKVIWKIAFPAGIATVSTLAGAGTGVMAGTGMPATFNAPEGVAVDAYGNVYVSDYLTNLISKITIVAGVATVSTLAGGGTGVGDLIDGPAANSKFGNPSGIALDAYGNVYVADSFNNAIRKITVAATGATVSTLAGNGTAGANNGAAASATFNFPRAVAVDARGSVVYVADVQNNLIRKISFPLGVATVSTLAGGAPQPAPGMFGDGTGTSAYFGLPYDVVLDASGTAYVADSPTGSIRKIQ